jgi:hypothetical protein
MTASAMVVEVVAMKTRTEKQTQDTLSISTYSFALQRFDTLVIKCHGFALACAI